jgi:hypothetical protein
MHVQLQMISHLRHVTKKMKMEDARRAIIYLGIYRHVPPFDLCRNP